MSAEEDDDDDFFKEFGVEDLDVEENDAELHPSSAGESHHMLVYIIHCHWLSFQLGLKIFHERDKRCERLCTAWHLA